MPSRPDFRLVLVALAAIAGLVPSAAQAFERTSLTFTAPADGARACHTRPVEAAGVQQQRHVSADTGLLTLRTAGKGDWDVAVFDALTGRHLASAAGTGAQEVAQGFVAKGQQLILQACRRDSDAATLRATLETVALRTVDPSARTPWSIVTVATPTPAEKTRLVNLGFDEVHSGTRRSLDVLLHGNADAARLKRFGFEFRTKVADLQKLDAANAEANARYAARTRRSALPSGRTDYRHLADYENEMKELAKANPGLVKLITLKNKTLEGRDVVGIEITKNVNLDDGKPVFLQLGVHHAREWPAGEHPMEWAYELVRGYGHDDRVTRLVDSTRTIVVPITNPDGFNLSRESPFDPGNAGAAVDLPPELQTEIPVDDPAYTAVILADINAGTFAYKRRNCRLEDGKAPEEGQCGSRENRELGTDTNRNYGGFWGGPGASLDPGSDTFRGYGPFSEPETQNVKDLVSHNQVVTLITNHTFSNLLLRPPGLRSQGFSPDEPVYKELGDSMAANNGYRSGPSWSLYDTSGTTEDWSYYATGGFGFTYEIGPDEFHPPYEENVAEYDGAGDYAGKGNRAAYFVAQESTANAARHSILEGRAPEGAVVKIRKQFATETSPVIKDDQGNTDPPQSFTDTLEDEITVGAGGRFEWHVNPSTRPIVQKERKVTDVAAEPARTIDISTPVPTPPRPPRDIPFDVAAGENRLIRAVTTGVAPADDYDIYLYENSVAPENLVSSSAGGTADELIQYPNANPGKYILRVVNFAAVGPYDGSISLFGSAPGSERTLPPQVESWNLSCFDRSGRLLGEEKVEVARGERRNVGACEGTTGPAGSKGDVEASARSRFLRFAIAIDRRRLRRALRLGIRTRVRCTPACRPTVSLVVDRRTARRLKLKSLRVARGGIRQRFSGRRTFKLRFTRDARRRLRGAGRVRFALVGVATDALGRRVTARRSFRLR
ncbi:MAG TPA: M14 family zinc carboxypeptidase [Solirubrobacteraceae bacterium]|jgi:murein tripeptide amidase MpaA